MNSCLQGFKTSQRGLLSLALSLSPFLLFAFSVISGVYTSVRMSVEVSEHGSVSQGSGTSDNSSKGSENLLLSEVQSSQDGGVNTKAVSKITHYSLYSALYSDYAIL